MSDVRNKYSIDIYVNKRSITSVEISQHYKDNHSDSINDALIIRLVQMLDGKEFQAESVKGEFVFYKAFLVLDSKRYKLVWTLENNKLYIGVIAAHRSEQKG